MSTVARPSLIPRIWHWRYELALTAGVLLGTIGIGATVGLDWLIAATAATMALLAAALIWPRSRRRHHRAGLVRHHPAPGPDRLRARLDPDQGRGSPVVLYSVPVDFGRRVWLWCRAGITPGDLEAARDILRSACWASDVRLVVNDRRSHIVVLEVIRRLPPEPPAPGTSGWPYRDHSNRTAPSQENLPSYHGLRFYRPFG